MPVVLHRELRLVVLHQLGGSFVLDGLVGALDLLLQLFELAGDGHPFIHLCPVAKVLLQVVVDVPSRFLVRPMGT
jgi:hypothetical protein